MHLFLSGCSQIIKIKRINYSTFMLYIFSKMKQDISSSRFLTLDRKRPFPYSTYIYVILEYMLIHFWCKYVLTIELLLIFHFQVTATHQVHPSTLWKVCVRLSNPILLYSSCSELKKIPNTEIEYRKIIQRRAPLREQNTLFPTGKKNCL